MPKLSHEDCDALMVSEGIARYDAKLARSQESGELTTSPAAGHLLQAAVGTLADAVKDWVKASSKKPGRKAVATKYLKLIKPNVVALTAARVVLDGVARQRPYLSSAYAVGSALELEVWLGAIQRDVGEKYLDIKKLADKSSSLGRRRTVLRALAAKNHSTWKRWPRKDKYVLGTVLIELLIQNTGLVEEEMAYQKLRSGAYKSTTLLRPTEATLEWLRGSNEAHRSMFPMLLPTSYPPYDWEDQWTGGYSGNIFSRWALFRTRETGVLEQMTPEVMPEVYRAVNSLQRTEWKVNQDVLAMAEYCWEEQVVVASIPPADPDAMPVRTWGVGEKPDALELREWKRQAARVHLANSKLASRRAHLSRTLFVAKAFQHQPFYFPHKADFRGRFYPAASFLSPQGDDLSKALLCFNRGKDLLASDVEGVAWLMIHGANCWGEDKVTLAQRCQWVEDNEGMIRAVARDPMDERSWCDADEPWQFLAFCLEYDSMVDAHSEGSAHVTYLPVGMDGSNNGLQLYSLALRDPIGAKATNVSPSDTPQDVYQEVADAVYRRLTHDSEFADEREQVMARKWLGFIGKRLPRSATKRSVMTLPYGATRFACQNYVEDWYEEELLVRGLKDNRPFFETFTYSRYLTNLLWSSIHEVVVGARTAMSWLQSVADECTAAQLPVEWKSPSGFIVSQSNFTSDGMRIRTRVGDRIVVRKGRTWGNKLSKRAMRNGIAPNFIHALDAAVLTKTVNACVSAGIQDFAMVHDCYATHCTDAPKLASTLRKVVADIFSGDVLAEFKQTVEDQLGKELPPLPEYGDLDPNVVRSSLYFFA